MKRDTRGSPVEHLSFTTLLGQGFKVKHPVEWKESWVETLLVEHFGVRTMIETRL